MEEGLKTAAADTLRNDGNVDVREWFDFASARVPQLQEEAIRAAAGRGVKLGEELGLSGMYCQQCRRCLPQCPAGVDIPTLMRASMYAFGYRPGKAGDALRGWMPADFACTRCRECGVRCALGLDIRSKAADIARLLDNSGAAASWGNPA